jgi:hypothetical protein
VPRKARGRWLFRICDSIDVNFKKLDANRRASNYPTRTALAFTDQRSLIDLRTIDPVTHVVAGYIPNAAETDFEIVITCPGRDDNYWELTLSGAEVVSIFEASNSKRFQDALEDRVKERRVRVRKTPRTLEEAESAITRTSVPHSGEDEDATKEKDHARHAGKAAGETAV